MLLRLIGGSRRLTDCDRCKVGVARLLCEQPCGSKLSFLNYRQYVLIDSWSRNASSNNATSTYAFL